MKGASRVFWVVFLVFALVVGGWLYAHRLSVTDDGGSGSGVNERYVNVQFLVQSDLSYQALSGATVYVWTDPGMTGDAVEILATDASGVATTQGTYLTGSKLYVFVTAAGYYPVQLTVDIPSAAVIASEQTVVTVPAIRLLKASTTVALTGTIGATTALVDNATYNAGGQPFIVSLTISGLEENSAFGASYIDYSTVQRDQYIGPLLIVKTPGELSITTPYYRGEGVGTDMYYMFKLDQIINKASDSTDGTLSITLNFVVLGPSGSSVTVEFYLFDTVLVSSLDVPYTIVPLADASITGVTITL